MFWKKIFIFTSSREHWLARGSVLDVRMLIVLSFRFKSLSPFFTSKTQVKKNFAKTRITRLLPSLPMNPQNDKLMCGPVWLSFTTKPIPQSSDGFCIWTGPHEAWCGYLHTSLLSTNKLVWKVWQVVHDVTVSHHAWPCQSLSLWSCWRVLSCHYFLSTGSTRPGPHQYCDMIGLTKWHDRKHITT